MKVEVIMPVLLFPRKQDFHLFRSYWLGTNGRGQTEDEPNRTSSNIEQEQQETRTLQIIGEGMLRDRLFLLRHLLLVRELPSEP